MIEAACVAIAMLSFGAAVRPRPTARTVARPDLGSPSRRRVWRPGRRARRVPQATAAEVALWCEALARVVRGGSSLSTALRSAEPPTGCGDDVGRVVLALDRGRPLADALDVSTASPHLNLAVTVLRACALNGGPPAEPLDRAAAALRGRAAAIAERQTQSAQARLSAVVMTVLPTAMLTLLLVTSSTTRSATTSPAGLTAVALGGALNLGGWRWMRRIIDGVAS